MQQKHVQNLWNNIESDYFEEILIFKANVWNPGKIVPGKIPTQDLLITR